MLIRRAPMLTENAVTDYALYQQRRTFLKTLGGVALLSTGASPLLAATQTSDAPLTAYEDIVSYNNFIELASDKYTPAKLAAKLRTRPWSVVVDGECAKPGTLNLEDILKQNPTEERIYRLRCVEGWSMVIPWLGKSGGICENAH